MSMIAEQLRQDACPYQRGEQVVIGPADEHSRMVLWGTVQRTFHRGADGWQVEVLIGERQVVTLPVKCVSGRFSGHE